MLLLDSTSKERLVWKDPDSGCLGSTEVNLLEEMVQDIMVRVDLSVLQ